MNTTAAKQIYSVFTAIGRLMDILRLQRLTA
jgi:hypothetical protein